MLSQDKIAVIHFIEGESIIKNNRYNGKSIETIVGRNVYNGDIVKTYEKSSCYIRFIDNKTHVKLFPNSIVKLLEDANHIKIELIKGNIYAKNLYQKDNKTYIFTDDNQIYLSNHRIWISSDDAGLNQIFSLDTDVQVFNSNISKSVNIESRYLINIDEEDFIYSDDFYEIVPEYVLNDISDYNYNQDIIELEKYDLIPIYGERILNKELVDPYDISFDFGTKFLNRTTHIKFGLYPQYQRKNLYVSMKIESYVSPSGNDLGGDWDDIYDFIDKLQLNYTYNDYNKDMKLSVGKVENISFGSGYLFNEINNNLDYPRRSYSGLLLNYKFDVDFMDFQLVIPSIRDFKNSGGVVGARTSLFISHNFPLTLGFGFVADINQFSNISNYLQKDGSKRSVYGAEFDFNYNLIESLDFRLNLFGEFVGIWYPDYNYYILSDDEDVSDDLRWRKGTWGINAPGLSFEFDNRYLFKLSLNYNSATFIPNYFNSTYLYNRARFYKANLESIQFSNDFPLVQKQINSLNRNFLIECPNGPNEECEYFIPKDVYPILFSNSGFSAYDTYGLSTEFKYNFYKYYDLFINTSVFVEDSNASSSYYTFQMSLNINSGLVRNLDNFKFYYSNIFFTNFSDSNRMNYGIKAKVILPMRLSLIIDLGQVYYDSNNIIDNNIDRMSNSSINIKYNF